MLHNLTATLASHYHHDEISQAEAEQPDTVRMSHDRFGSYHVCKPAHKPAR
jgi:hypothetical protein